MTNSAPCLLGNIPVSAGTGSTMDGAFYIEEPDRSAGVRVAWTGSTVPTGKKVTILGTVGNNASTGEREISASDVFISTDNSTVNPVGMNGLLIGGVAPSTEIYTQSITGGVGLYNTGLLVRVWGKVTYAGSDFVYIDDGSNIQDGLDGAIIVPLDGSAIPPTYPAVKGLRVYCGTLTKPGIGDYVSITGISSTATIGSNIVRCIRLRNQEDIDYIKQYKRCLRGWCWSDGTLMAVGSRVRFSDMYVWNDSGTVFQATVNAGGLPWNVNVHANTQLPGNNECVTVTGTFEYVYPEAYVQADGVYLGGSAFGAMGTLSLSRQSTEAMNNYTARSFKPWPYPTAEEVLASDSFKAQYNQQGAIGWALSQPDGTVLDLSVETVISEYYDGKVLGLKEWFEPLQNNTPKLLLYLEKPVKGLSDKMTAIDIVGATITTLSNGQRALVAPKAVYAYTDQNGQFILPLPWSKHQQSNTTLRANSLNESSSEDVWPWKLKITP